ncbi:hypothetical protein ACFLSJ_01505 [Verrucomicrobiota bacterium]
MMKRLSTTPFPQPWGSNLSSSALAEPLLPAPAAVPDPHPASAGPVGCDLHRIGSEDFGLPVVRVPPERRR